MKIVKTYDAFNGGRITNALKKDLMLMNQRSKLLSPLMIAIIDNDTKKFNDLINTSNLEEEDIKGNTPLLIASMSGRLKMLKTLVEKGANIFHKNDKGEDFYDIAEYQYKFINNIKRFIEKEYPEFIASKKYNL